MAAIGIIGLNGRMGQAILGALTPHHTGQGIGRDGDPVALARSSEVLIDFSSSAALEATLDAAMAANVPLVVGTTGLEERHHWLIDQASERIAVLQTGNTSLGVTL